MALIKVINHIGWMDGFSITHLSPQALSSARSEAKSVLFIRMPLSPEHRADRHVGNAQQVVGIPRRVDGWTGRWMSRERVEAFLGCQMIRMVSEVNSILLCRKRRLGGAFMLSPAAVGPTTTPEASC